MPEFLPLLDRLRDSPLLNSFLCLSTAFILGTLIGFERQWRQRSAGLRTNVLVAVGAAAFADLGMRLMGPEGSTRIISYVVSGIGFLGAGVILKDGMTIRGLNTAATLWCSAAVGAMAGVGLQGEAVMVAGFVLSGNTLLRPLVNYLNRRPVHESTTEAVYRVHVICSPARVSDARDLLTDLLENARYPIREFETLSDTEDLVELAAVLVPTTAEPMELDDVVHRLETSEAVDSATWTMSATN